MKDGNLLKTVFVFSMWRKIIGIKTKSSKSIFPNRRRKVEEGSGVWFSLKWDSGKELKRQVLIAGKDRFFPKKIPISILVPIRLYLASISSVAIEEPIANRMMNLIEKNDIKKPLRFIIKNLSSELWIFLSFTKNSFHLLNLRSLSKLGLPLVHWLFRSGTNNFI